MKAVYAVFYRLEDSKTIKIGAQGKREFNQGIYVYVGSAMNGVRSRLERHLSSTENKHWHIDYFSSVAKPLDYLIIPEESRWECKLADIVSEYGKSMDGLGASDCSCAAHLFRIQPDLIETA